MVTLPKSVIDWLLGEGPNDKGEWFEQPVDRQRYWWRKDLRAALSAALAQAEQPVAMKPLEWERWPQDGSSMFEGIEPKRKYVARALTPFGAIFLMSKNAVEFTLVASGAQKTDGGSYKCADAAKAAAQADYERRILSALAHPPAKREAGETLKPRDNVVVDSVFGPVGGIIVEPVEGWWKVQFRDGSIAVVRPSSIRAALEASHE